MRSYLLSLRFKGAAPASSSPHLIISEQNCLLAVFPLQSKAADPNAGKKTTIKKSRGRFLFIRLVSGDYQDRLQQFVVHMLTRETHAWIPNVNI